MSSPSESPKMVERSTSQSLFQIYYLGCTRVDRRCSSVVMPWIIEELKLKTQEMKFLWLTPGPETVSFVADSGQELFSHSYTSILQCCIAVDGISFAYVSRKAEDNKYYCHVFQALTYEEAEVIMSKFKAHAREEVSVGSTISRSKMSDLPTKSSGLIFSSSLKHHPPEVQPTQDTPREGSEYHVQFLGKFEVPSPSTSSDNQVQTIDKLVSRLKENYDMKSKKKESFSSRIRAKLSSSASLKSSSTPTLGKDDVGSATPPSDDQMSSQSNPSLCSQGSGSSSDVSIPIFSVSSDPVESEGNNKGVEPTEHVQNGIAGGQSDKQDSVDPANGDIPHGEDKTTHNRNDSVCSDFDTIPELASLQDSALFQSLSGPLALPSRRVKLVFSDLTVFLVSEDGGERIMKKNIRNIICCAQGKKEPNYFAFTGTSKQGGEKKHHCHLFLSSNKKEIFKILDTFQSSFLHALSFSLPAALCDTCPLRQLHTLCRNLQGVSTQVAQSIIQECLSTVGEVDYANIMKEYKLSEHADHEYTQIIVLVGLIRQYFQRQQALHTHPGTGGLLTNTSLEASSRLRLPALSRAKDAIASSIENLKNRPSGRGSRFTKNKPTDKQQDDQVTQSVNVRSVSPLFSKKTNLDTLMAPIPTTPVKQRTKEEVRRERSWSGYSQSPRSSSDILDAIQTTRRVGSSQDKQGAESETTSKLVQSVGPVPTEDVLKSPKAAEEVLKSPKKKKRTSFDLGDKSAEVEFKVPTTPMRRVKSQRPRDMRHDRQSKTPPATTSSHHSKKGFRKTHRRATSLAMPAYSSTWRQDIFESCNTPDKRHGSLTTENLLEEFEIIDIDQLGGSWRMGKGSLKTMLESSSPRTRTRKRWREAIEQQIILNRMEKQNSLFMKASTDAELKRVKLCYTTPELDNKDAIQEWNTLLTSHDSLSDDELRMKVMKGIPPSKRAEMWPLLAQRYKTRVDSDWSLPQDVSGEEGLKRLLEKTTEFEHTIFVDLARTFPGHPFFTRPMDGQVSLRNVLHSYAVADTETGYCQGLSFVTGIILIHSKDDVSAFELLYQLMTLYNYREIYFENLTNLQMRLYQLSRLLHDLNYSLCQHLRVNEINPFFYAAPWFLTIFASQFPIAFTARVFDMIFCEGTDFILKVIVALLQVHEDSILECDGMELTCKYLKSSLPDLALEHIDEIFETASKFDFGDRLTTFESEYETMVELNTHFKSDLVVDDFPSVAEVLKKQTNALIEQLAICHAHNTRLESMVNTMRSELSVQNQRIQELESKLMSNQPADSTHSSGGNLNFD